jgi:hypothetical protein
MGLGFSSSAAYKMSNGDKPTVVIVELVAGLILLLSGITQLNN